MRLLMSWKLIRMYHGSSKLNTITTNRYWRWLYAHPYLVACVLSVLVSLIIFSHQHITDVDGFLYLRAARAYLQQGYDASVAIYRWPLYSLLVAYTHKLTGLNVFLSAYLLNVMLSTLLVISFMLLVDEVYRRQGFSWLGLLVIINFTRYNHYRDDLLRDHGYWAMSLLALVCLLRLARSQCYRYGIAWGLLMLIATLFRIEGAILLGLVPLGLLCCGKDVPFLQKIHLLASAYAVVILIAISVAIYMVLQHNPNHLGRIQDLLVYSSNPVSMFIGPLQSAIDMMRNSVLDNINEFAGSNAQIMIVTGVIGIFVIQFIGSVQILYLLLGAYGIAKRVINSPAALSLLIWTVLLNVVIAQLFTMQYFFTSARYLTLLCLLYLVWVPGAIALIYQQWRQRAATFAGKRWLFPLVCAGFLSLSIINVSDFGYAKAYLVKGSNWLIKQQNIPLLITNSKRVAGLNEEYHDIIYEKFDKEQRIVPQVVELYRSYQQQPAYFAIMVSRNSDELNNIIAIFPTAPVKRFDGRRGDTLLIFSNKI